MILIFIKYIIALFFKFGKDIGRFLIVDKKKDSFFKNNFIFGGKNL